MTEQHTAKEWDEINTHRAHLAAEKALGHTWLITEQLRFSESPTLPGDLKVWISCTCQKWAPDAFPTRGAALNAYKEHRP